MQAVFGPCPGDEFVRVPEGEFRMPDSDQPTQFNNQGP